MTDRELYLKELRLAGYDVEEFGMAGGPREPQGAFFGAMITWAEGGRVDIRIGLASAYIVTWYTGQKFVTETFANFDGAADFISEFLREHDS